MCKIHAATKVYHAMTDDEIRQLKQINTMLFRRGLPQVKAIEEFQLRAYRQNNPVPPVPPPEATLDE